MKPSAFKTDEKSKPTLQIIGGMLTTYGMVGGEHCCLVCGCVLLALTLLRITDDAKPSE